MNFLEKLESILADQKINVFYYYPPWIMAKTQTYDFKIIDDFLVVSLEGNSYLYWAPIGKDRFKKAQSVLKTEGIDQIFFDYPDFKCNWNAQFVDENYINSPKKIVEHKGKDFHELRHCLNQFKALNMPLYEGKLNHFDSKAEAFLLNPNLYSEEEEMATTLSFMEQVGNHEGLWAQKIVSKENEILSVNIFGELFEGCLIYLVNKNKPNILNLSDVSRYMFYEMVLREYGDCIVNDGSDLDDAGLKRFKRKYNPIEMVQINSWVENG